jgi:chaperone BCS1
VNWYKAHGIPHTIGFLLKGAPGTGKTSTIKAIANELKRHILNVRLTSDMTIETVKKLFFSNTIRVKDMDGNIRNITVPCNERIYVMEDIDCLTDIVLDRKYKPELLVDLSLSKEELTNKQIFEKKEKEKRINLSVLLNLLDGILETPGRVLVFTSNYPERLDAALLRPGRIDSLVEFTECDVDTLYEMCCSFYSASNVQREALYPFDNRFSPALVQEQIICSSTFEVLCDNLKSF